MAKIAEVGDFFSLLEESLSPYVYLVTQSWLFVTHGL